ncbi:U3 small nucleolar RNA-associated protein 6 homolog [Styela clava]
MAEFVMRRSEDMLPEFEQMQRVGLFNENELKAIIKKTMSHEYKLVRRVKVKKDFLAYIQYKINVISLIKKRRKRLNYFFKKDEIEYAMVGKIHSLFKQCSFRWPDDLKLWLSHIEFCKQWNKKLQLSKIWTSMLQLHGNNNIHLWVMAAKWELEDNHSVDNARQIFLRGIRHHPENSKLWQEYFRMELIHVLTTRQRLSLLKEGEQADDEELKENFLKGEAACIVYKNAIVAIPNDSKCKCGFLEIALHFAFFAGDIINDIIDDLMDNHNNDPYTRSMLAKLHLHSSVLNPATDSSDQVTLKADSWAAEKKCWEDFDSALIEVNNSEMWKEYITFLYERINDSTNNDKGKFEITNHTLRSSSKQRSVSDERIQHFISVSERGHKSKMLDDDCYLLYANQLAFLGRELEAIKILHACVEEPDCAFAIKLRLLEMLVANEKISFEQNIDIKQFFRKLSKLISSMSQEEQDVFWTLWFDYAKKKNDEEFVLKAVEISETLKSSQSNRIKSLYIEWSVSRHGVENIMEIYEKKLCALCSPSLDLIKTVIKVLESSENQYVESITACYEDAVKNFGLEYPTVWLDYISHILKIDPVKVGKIHWRAMKTLKPDLVEEFVSGYTLIHAKT